MAICKYFYRNSRDRSFTDAKQYVTYLLNKYNFTIAIVTGNGYNDIIETQHYGYSTLLKGSFYDKKEIHVCFCDWYGSLDAIHRLR